MTIAKRKTHSITAYRLDMFKLYIQGNSRIVEEFFACMFIDTQCARACKPQVTNGACAAATVIPFKAQLSVGSSKNFLRLNH